MYFPTAKLWINDLLQIPKSTSHKQSYTFKGKEIKYVDLFGVVVGKWKVRSYTMYSVDDGTGVITCMINAEHPRNMRKEKKAADIMKQLNVLDEEHNSPKIVMALKYLMRPVNEFYTDLNNITWGDTIRTRGVLTEFHGQREVRTTKIWKVKFLNDEIHRIAEVAIVYRNLEEYEKRRQSKASKKLHSKFPTAPSLSIAGCSTTQVQRKSEEDKGHSLISKLQKNCGTTVSRNLFSKTTIEFEDATTKNKSKATGNKTESCKREKERLCKDNDQHSKVTINDLISTTRTHSQEYEGTAIQDKDVVNGVKNFHGLGTENEQTNTVKNGYSFSDTSDTQNNIKGILNPDSEAHRNKSQPCQTKTNNLSLSGADKQEDSYDVSWKERTCEQPVLPKQQQQRKQGYSNIRTEDIPFCKGHISQSHKNHEKLPTKEQFFRQISLEQTEEKEEERVQKSSKFSQNTEREFSFSQVQSRSRDSYMATGKVELDNGGTLLFEEQNKEKTSEGQTSCREEGQLRGRQMVSIKPVAIYEDRFCKQQQTSLIPKEEIKHSANSEIIEHAFDDSMEDILRSMPIASHDQSSSRYTETHKQSVASSTEDDCSAECFLSSGSGDPKSNQNRSQAYTEWNEEGKYLKEKVHSVIETLTKWAEDFKKLKQDMKCIERNIEKWDQEGKKLHESLQCVKVKCFLSPKKHRCQNSNNKEHTIQETENKNTSLESEHTAAVPEECNKNRKRVKKNGQISEDRQKLREKRMKTFTQ